MENQQITVVYSWTAKDGRSNELQAIYKEITKNMQQNEPDALNVQCYFDNTTGKLVVIDVFKNADAVAFHLSSTAANQMANLHEVATPGEFVFCGDLPEEMKQAAIGMGLDATFVTSICGFKR